MKYLIKARNLYRKIFRRVFFTYNRMRLRNRNFSIISKDCIGGIIAHDLKVRFDSPTINLWFNAEDFIKFCKDLKFYLSERLIEDKDSGKNYPVGFLGSGDKKITVNFMHYESFYQAEMKWYERTSRIHWDKLFFIMTDREYCNEKLAHEFDMLPYEHKAFLTFRDIEGVKSSVKFNDYGLPPTGDKGMDPPLLMSYCSEISALRILDKWDYVSFLNA